MMAPLLLRTWTLRGRTPSLKQQGGHRKKVSVAAALWLSPQRIHMGLYFHTLADGYFDNWYVRAFREAILRVYKGEPIRALEAQFADRLSSERPPPFAPRLNPVEVLWCRLKDSRLINFGLRDTAELNSLVVAELAAITGDRPFPRKRFPASELPIRV